MSSTARPLHAKPRELLWILAALPLLYIFVCTFPGFYQPVAAGLDESWKFALNSLASSGRYLFGRDVVFTYGPLGFLLVPRFIGVGTTLHAAEAFWCSLHILLFTASAWRFRNRLGLFLLFSAGYWILSALGLWPEYIVLFVTCALVVLSMAESGDSTIFAVLAALLAALAPLMKWSLGISAASVLAGSWVVLLLRRSRRSRMTLLISVSTWTLVFATASLIYFHSLANWINWLRLSTELVSGYSSVMSITGSTAPLLLALGGTAMIIVLSFLLAGPTRLLIWIFAPYLFLAFKEGFVRQDGHRFIFFLALTTIPALLLLAPSLADRAPFRLATSFAGLSLLAIGYASHFEAFPALQGSIVESFLLLDPGANNISSLFTPRATEQQLRTAAGSALQPDVLPADWCNTINLRNSTVSILPYELSIAAANPLRWKPVRTLQLYNAYTPALDETTAAELGFNGADYIIVSFEAIDGRNFVLDTPLTWRALVAHYAVAAVDPNTLRILLVRKPSENSPGTLRETIKRFASMEDWVPVPFDRHLVYASLDVAYTAFGRWAALFYQVPPLYLEVQRQSGTSERYRLVSGTARSGILINHLPANGFDLSEVLNGRAIDAAVRFRLLSPQSARYFQKQYRWHLVTSRTLLSPSVNYVSRPPVISAFAPVSGAGRSADIQVTISNPNGIQNLDRVYLLVNRELNGVNSCFISYEASDNRLWLLADDGHGAAGEGHPGDRATLANAQCTVPLDQFSTSRVTANEVQLRVKINFSRTFDGPRHIYIYASDLRGLRSEWQSRADWRIN